jgi:uncharacterized DUF497 family protein
MAKHPTFFVATIRLIAGNGSAIRRPVDPAPRYDWDEVKRATNLRDHGIDFAAARRFEWETAFVFPDDREGYGELREVAIGFIGVGLHVLVFTQRGTVIRIISLRRAEKSDLRKYVEAIK